MADTGISDPVPLVGVDASDEEAISRELIRVCSTAGAILEQMDDLDDDGRVQIRVHATGPSRDRALELLAAGPPPPEAT